MADAVPRYNYTRRAVSRFWVQFKFFSKKYFRRILQLHFMLLFRAVSFKVRNGWVISNKQFHFHLTMIFWNCYCSTFTFFLLLRWFNFNTNFEMLYIVFINVECCISYRSRFSLLWKKAIVLHYSSAKQWNIAKV